MLPTMSLDSFHTAHLDPASGYGLVVCPRPEDDVVLDGHSLFTAAWDTACESLASLGWSPVRDDAGFLCYLGATVDGGLVVEAADPTSRSVSRVDPGSVASAQDLAGPQRREHQDGLEEQAHESLGVGVEPEGVLLLDVLRDVAGEDRDEERRQQTAHERAAGLRGGHERGAETDLDHARPQHRQVLVEREPVRDLGLELLAGEGQVSGAGEDHRRPECEAGHGAEERHGPSIAHSRDPGHPLTGGRAVRLERLGEGGVRA